MRFLMNTTFTGRRHVQKAAICFVLALVTVNTQCEAGIILHTTYDRNSDDNTVTNGSDDTAEHVDQGYFEHHSLSISLDPYRAVGVLSNGCSATWIGNDASGGWLLTHSSCAVDPLTEALTFTDWNGQTHTSSAGNWTRFDDSNVSLMRLDGVSVEIDDPFGGLVGQPTLYGGAAEAGELVTWVGYGVRGTGILGEQSAWGPGRAAAQNIIDSVTGTEMFFDFDAPLNGAVNDFEGHVSTGDEGGGAFIMVDGVPILTGVVAGGDSPGGYSDAFSDTLSQVTRVSSAQTFISSTFSGAQFTAAVPEPSSTALLLALSGSLLGIRRRRD